jgi:hypothetical protein
MAVDHIDDLELFVMEFVCSRYATIFYHNHVRHQFEIGNYLALKVDCAPLIVTKFGVSSGRWLKRIIGWRLN